MDGSRDGEREPTADACLTLLADEKRRAVLLALYDRGAEGAGSVPVEEAVPEARSTPAYVALTHSHLPKLADHDVVRWDRENDTVAPGPAFEAIEPFVERLDAGRERLPDDWRAESDR